VTDSSAIVVLSVIEDEARRSLVIELSDGTSCEVAVGTEEARGIAPGLELSDQQLAALQQAQQRKKAARQVFLWLDRRPRTRADLERRLREKGYSREVAGQVLDRFEAEGLVDDRAFAEAFGRERLRNRPVGPRWLAGRLRQAGVDGAVVRSVVDGLFDEFEEVELATRALARKRVDCEDESGRQKAARFLNARGFSTSAAVEAVRRVRTGDI
jgi:regulatory protein